MSFFVFSAHFVFMISHRNSGPPPSDGQIEDLIWLEKENKGDSTLISNVNIFEIDILPPRTLKRRFSAPEEIGQDIQGRSNSYRLPALVHILCNHILPAPLR